MVSDQKTFKPRTTYRYLPGQISKNLNDLDLKIYNEHKFRMFMVKPVVNTKPFELNPGKWLNRKKLREDLAYAIAVDKENKELLKRIYLIDKIGGDVNTYNPIAYRRNDKWKTYEKKKLKIQKENKSLHRKIVKSTSYYQTKVYAQEWQNKTLKFLQHSTIFPFIILKRKCFDDILRSQASISHFQIVGKLVRPLCFLEFEVKNGEKLGKAIIELYYDYAPVTVQNFLCICKGENGLSYKNCSVHRIISNEYLETGDITQGNGRGGFSIYGRTFPEENHVLKHSKAGVLSMKRIPHADNNSQFCITFKRMESLDHKNVVFGRVIKGNENILKIQGYARRIGKPYVEIVISDCGECGQIERNVGISGNGQRERSQSDMTAPVPVIVRAPCPTGKCQICPK